MTFTVAPNTIGLWCFLASTDVIPPETRSKKVSERSKRGIAILRWFSGFVFDPVSGQNSTAAFTGLAS